MKLLAVDTSCDESCVAIVDTKSWKLEADIVFSHVAHMQQYGGIVPEIASREHLKALPHAVHRALEGAQLSLEQIDGFVATNEPGLIGALLVGVSYVKALAFSLNKPFYVQDHIEAHLFSPLLSSLDLTTPQPPPLPWIALVVSGGHTELFKVSGPMQYSWLGGTLDDAAGEAFDKVGKLLGMPYPAGPLMDKMVQANPQRAQIRSQFNFPRPTLPNYSFSYSGLKTSVSQAIDRISEADRRGQTPALVASAQEAILAQLKSQVERAATALRVSSIVVTGGVACNSRLRELLPTAFFPPPRHCSDNAAMIALAAALKWRNHLLKPASAMATASPRSAILAV